MPISHFASKQVTHFHEFLPFPFCITFPQISLRFQSLLVSQAWGMVLHLQPFKSACVCVCGSRLTLPIHTGACVDTTPRALSSHVASRRCQPIPAPISRRPARPGRMLGLAAWGWSALQFNRSPLTPLSQLLSFDDRLQWGRTFSTESVVGLHFLSWRWEH